MNVIERLEELAAEASERPWAPGTRGGTVVTQGRCVNRASPGDREYYGGGPILESCCRVDAEFLCAVVNALPGLLKVVHEVAPEHQLAKGGFANPEGCPLCRVLAELFAETALVELPPGDARA